MGIRAGLAIAGALTLALTGTAGATRPSSLTLKPAAVAPGGALSADIYCLRPAGAGPLASELTSDGFAAPIPLHYAGDGGTGGIGIALAGTGRATAKPGRYSAAFDCWGWIVRADITVS
ncbi:hypothetical protein SAMN05421504_10749 [Amycolatopsis xylanica]|uniref:Uncharacterized protein n=1 Tax=Amycolatopsis xylanica TaxID=589385 RepID=A0A1H3MY98_9PSEU|nr:hypothetical protein [Amycolatopsis xylanica]SDY81460.1 hypothetical protein SAMN05421504_10749 [Amycolatopsis xylanica]